MTIRIDVDFNTAMANDEGNAEDKISINLDRSKPEEGRILNLLSPGLRVVLYDETMEVEATLLFDGEHQLWLGIPDWSTRRDLL